MRIFAPVTNYEIFLEPKNARIPCLYDHNIKLYHTNHKLNKQRHDSNARYKIPSHQKFYEKINEYF